MQSVRFSSIHSTFSDQVKHGADGGTELTNSRLNWLPILCDYELCFHIVAGTLVHPKLNQESPSLSILCHLDPKLWKKCNHHIIWPRNVNIWVWRKRTPSESRSSCTNVIVVWIQAFYHQRRRFIICFSWFDFSLKLLLII